jgi:hypothetical protein
MDSFRQSAYLECVIVRQVSLDDVDVGAPVDLCILRNLGDSRGLVSHDTDNGVVMVAGKLASELVLFEAISAVCVASLENLLRGLWKYQ